MKFNGLKSLAMPAAMALAIVTPAGAHADFVYVPSASGLAPAAPGYVSAFTLATLETTGDLASASGSPYEGGFTPQRAVITPNGEYLYVSNLEFTFDKETHGDIAGYRINSVTGSLDPLWDPDGQEFEMTAAQIIAQYQSEALLGAQEMTVTPDGEYLYVSARWSDTGGPPNASGQVWALKIDESTGKLSHVEDLMDVNKAEYTFTGEPYHPNGLVAASNGYLYAVNGGKEGSADFPYTIPWLAPEEPQSGSVSVFRVESNGHLTLVNAVPTPTGGKTPKAMVVTKNAGRAYVANTNSNTISAFDMSADGTLSPIGGSPVSIGSGASFEIDMALSPDESLLFATVSELDAIAVLKIDPTTGLPVLHTTLPAGDHPNKLAVTSDGKHLLATNLLSKDISVYAIGEGNDAPTPIGSQTSKVPLNPADIVVIPSALPSPPAPPQPGSGNPASSDPAPTSDSPAKKLSLSLSLKGAKTQKITSKGVLLRASCSAAPCTLKVSGKVKGFKLKSVTRKLQSTQAIALRLKLTSRDLKRLRRALRGHSYAARMTVVATHDGQQATVTKTIKLKG